MNKQIILQNRINEIIHLSNTGDHTKALQKNKQLLKSYSGIPSLYNMAGALSIKCGKPAEAIKFCNKAIKIDPDYADAYNNLAAAHKDKAIYDKSIEYAEKALSLNPNLVDAHLNMGNTLKEMDKKEEAIEAYNRAISLQPKYANAHFNLANTYRELGLHDQAIKSYEETLKLNPQLLPAYNNLAGVYAETGNHQKARDHYAVLINAGVDNPAVWQSLGDVLLKSKFTEYDTTTEFLFSRLLQTTGVIRPAIFSKQVLKFLNLHPVISPLLKEDPVKRTEKAIAELGKSELFLTLLSKSTVVESGFETLLTEIRRYALFHPDETTSIDGSQNLLHALALTCSINEFAFFEAEDETREVSTLEGRVSSKIDMLTLALYRPLSCYPSLETQVEETLPQLYKIYFWEPKEEEKLKGKLIFSTKIDNEVSKSVRQQYEENPYPRWVDTALYAIPQTYEQIAARKNLKTAVTSQKPKVLIAGCGTGEHAIATATRIKNASITAIDLSCSSLAYAKRKTQEYGLSNINYRHCDILNASSLQSRFDIIECNGVLHHMDDPVQGWKELLQILKPNGLMRVGLYSETARQHITAIRNIIEKQKINSDAKSIREFRNEILNTEDTSLKNILESRDFYSLSNCHDLLFNIQEHRFTIPELKKTFKDLDLKFLGFEIERETYINFISSYPDHESVYDLNLWTEYEHKNPNTFDGMYQFWVQKEN